MLISYFDRLVPCIHSNISLVYVEHWFLITKRRASVFYSLNLQMQKPINNIKWYSYYAKTLEHSTWWPKGWILIASFLDKISFEKIRSSKTHLIEPLKTKHKTFYYLSIRYLFLISRANCHSQTFNAYKYLQGTTSVLQRYIKKFQPSKHKTMNT